MLLTLAPAAQARPIDWQAELDRCRAMREQMEPLLLAGQGLSPIARSGTAARRCVGIDHHACRKGRIIDLGQLSMTRFTSAFGMPSLATSGPET
jgi:hypothetical protein